MAPGATIDAAVNTDTDPSLTNADIPGAGREDRARSGDFRIASDQAGHGAGVGKTLGTINGYFSGQFQLQHLARAAELDGHE